MTKQPGRNMPEDWPEQRAIPRGEDKQGRALQQEYIAAFHARGTAAEADLERGGKSYTVDEVLEEMRAMTAARRQEVAEGRSPVKRWLTATEAAELTGLPRPFMSRVFDSGVIQTVVAADEQRRALESHVITWHEQYRAHQQESMQELCRRRDDECS